MSVLLRIALESGATLCRMAPYLLFGFLVAGVLAVVAPVELVERHMGKGSRFLGIIKAALIGVPLPLCSCGVIPVAASLRRHGAGRGATASFLLSTPQTGVDSILVTLGLMGPFFAIFRPVAAFLSGILGGAAVEVFGERAGDGDPEVCTDECCAPRGHSHRVIRAIRHGFIVLPRNLAGPLVLGTLIAGAISTLVQKEYVELAVGGGLPAMLVAMAAGIPMYVCATASVPIAAAMLAKGASAGAAVVFLMTGPATNAATIAAMWKMLGRRSTIVYLVSLAVISLALGSVADVMVRAHGVLMPAMTHAESPGTWEVMSAAALLGILAAAVLARGRSGRRH